MVDDYVNIMTLFSFNLKEYKMSKAEFLIMYKPYIYYLISCIKCKEALLPFKFYMSFREYGNQTPDPSFNEYLDGKITPVFLV